MNTSKLGSSWLVEKMWNSLSVCWCVVGSAWPLTESCTLLRWVPTSLCNAEYNPLLGHSGVYIYIYSPLVCKDWRVYSSCYVHSLCKPIVKLNVDWDCSNVRLVHRHLLSVFVVGVLGVGWCAWTYVCLGWTNYRNVIVVSSTTTIKTDNWCPVPGAGIFGWYDWCWWRDVLQFGK